MTEALDKAGKTEAAIPVYLFTPNKGLEADCKRQASSAGAGQFRSFRGIYKPFRQALFYPEIFSWRTEDRPVDQFSVVTVAGYSSPIWEEKAEQQVE